MRLCYKVLSLCAAFPTLQLSPKEFQLEKGKIGHGISGLVLFKYAFMIGWKWKVEMENSSSVLKKI